MAKYVYADELEGTGADGDPFRPAHEADHSTDPANYQRHYRLAEREVHIASDVRIPTYENLAEDPDTDVRVIDEAELRQLEADGRATHTPSELAEQRGTTVEEQSTPAGAEEDEPEDGGSDGDEDGGSDGDGEGESDGENADGEGGEE